MALDDAPPSLVLLAQLAQQAYSATPTWQASNDIQACRNVDGETLVIACRGTVPTDLANWRVDFHWWLRWRWPFGFVHSGFFDAARALWPQMAVQVAAWPGPVWFVGHSLGASLALLLAAMHRREARCHGRAPRIGVLALAPARVGGALFKLALADVELVLVRRANDIVPMVPDFLWFFRQPARLLHLRPTAILELAAAHDCAAYVADLTAWLEPPTPTLIATPRTPSALELETHA